jgi:AcrR family transcriptional regulator
VSSDKAQPILDAALRVFRCKSYHGTTTKEVADAAGVSVGTMFRLFPNKEDLLMGLLNELIQTVAPKLFTERIETSLADYLSGDMEGAVKAFIHSRLVLFHANRDLISVIHAESAYNPRLKQAMFERVYTPMRSLIEKFVTLGIAQGRFRAVEPSAAARSIASSVLYTFLDVWYQDLELTQPVLETIETQFVDLILRGLERRP